MCIPSKVNVPQAPAPTPVIPEVPIEQTVQTNPRERERTQRLRANPSRYLIPLGGQQNTSVGLGGSNSQ